MSPMKIVSNGQSHVLSMPGVETIRRDAQAVTVVSLQVSCETERPITLNINLTSRTNTEERKS
jgi:hypothetical protein